MSDSLIKDFVAHLKTSVPEATVRPALGKQYNFPAVIYSVRNGMRDLFYQDAWGMRNTEITLTVYSKSYDEIQETKQLIVTALHGFSGELGNSSVSSIKIETILDGYDDVLETVYRSTLILNIID
jgi:hypothetical protein